jgi:hypothetical protein
MAKAARKRKLEPAPHHSRKPRQARLPEMDDAKIEELHDAALSYASIRDRRQALTTQEVDLKQDLLRLMKSHQKEKYHYNGVEIEITHEEESVKVRVKKKEGDA